MIIRLLSLLIRAALSPITDRIDALEENVETLEKDWHRHDEPHMHLTYKSAVKDDLDALAKRENGHMLPTCDPTCGDCEAMEEYTCPDNPSPGDSICEDFTPKESK